MLLNCFYLEIKITFHVCSHSVGTLKPRSLFIFLMCFMFAKIDHKNLYAAYFQFLLHRFCVWLDVEKFNSEIWCRIWCVSVFWFCCCIIPESSFMRICWRRLSSDELHVLLSFFALSDISNLEGSEMKIILNNMYIINNNNRIVSS
jgi:hypothetical protein